MNKKTFYIIETDGRYFRGRGTANSRGEAEEIATKKSKKTKQCWWVVASHNAPTKLMAAQGVIYVVQNGMPCDVSIATSQISKIFRSFEKERNNLKKQRFINLHGRRLVPKIIKTLIVIVLIVFGIALANEFMWVN